jgi:ribosomal protein S17E
VQQGRVRTKTVKKASRVIIEKYYNRLTLDFDTNKRICEEVAIIQTKRLRNKISGFTTVRPFPLLPHAYPYLTSHCLQAVVRGAWKGLDNYIMQHVPRRIASYPPLNGRYSAADILLCLLRST